MRRILSFFKRFFPSTQAATPVGDVAYQLMERAEAHAGRDPHHAQELRLAALAYLRVVR
ncbi:hypothetical protein AwPolaro_05990 [Polaromonas sp.]|nr:hypothetical protein AwPolaro_05990 [Polaromonas sp.]